MSRTSIMCTKITALIIIAGVSVTSGLNDRENVNIMKTWKNNVFYGFRGIKYAEPPIGQLRFKGPVPHQTWNNISAILSESLNKDGSNCPSPQTSYDEDCLYLNVYTKDVNVTSNLRPVIVFIHPGGLYVGSGRSDDFGPEYLLEQHVVLVTFNYRLAFFGFTSIGSREAVGNAGFKDQALVLKWVRDHIHHFGGDSQCVTLMGDSAGAMSVALHLVSPLSRHLFHRAFLMSGSILPQTLSPTSQTNLITKLAQLLGCSEMENSFECVKRSDARNITDNLRNIFEFGWDNPVYPWLPIVEPKIDDEEPFMDEEPWCLLQAGKFNPIPIMLSTTEDEFSLSAMYLLEHSDLLNRWLTDFSRIGPICLQYNANETISSALKHRYITNEPNEKINLSNLFDQTAQCFSDGLVNFPVYRFAQIAKQFTEVYYMKFHFRGSYSGFKCNSSVDNDLCDEINGKKIIEHCDDLQYIFTSKHIPKITDHTSADGEAVEKYTALLYNFAKNGKPYYGPDLNASVSTKYNNDETYVRFDKSFVIDKVPFKDAPLWDNLFPLNANHGCIVD